MNQPVIKRAVLFVDGIQEPEPQAGGLKHRLVIALGLGGFRDSLHPGQHAAEPEGAVLLEIELQSISVPLDLGPEMGLVAVESRGTELKLLTDRGQRGAAEQGLVNGLAIRMTTG
jgi:hypothetical protein